MIVPLVTLTLLGGFLFSGYHAHWWDVLLYGIRSGNVEIVWEYRASIWGAALLGWSLRNDLSILWSGRGS